tara:strand:- start:679 stop:1059 length:381 start_codon:yes stop_codon:yes gene_type:complete
MLLAALEPGKEMAIANLFLAIFCLFTVAIPLLLITRGDKTQANREFVAGIVNPWSQVSNEAELAKVVLSDVTSSVEIEPNIEVNSEFSCVPVSGLGEVVSMEINGSGELNKSLNQNLPNDDELLVA